MLQTNGIAPWRCSKHAECLKTRLQQAKMREMDPPGKADFLRTIMNDELITIEVGRHGDPGPYPKHYKVQRALLASASNWFRVAVSDRFKEGNELMIRLPESDPKVIEDFLYWLYHERIPFHEDEDSGDDEGNSEEERLFPRRVKRARYYQIQDSEVEYDSDFEAVRSISTEYDSNDGDWEEDLNDTRCHTRCCLHTIRLWAFGDAHFLPKFQNQAMVHLYDNVISRCPEIAVIRAAYELTPPGSEVRALIMDRTAEGLRAGKAGRGSVELRRGYKLSELEPLGVFPGFMTDLAIVLTNGMKYGPGVATTAPKMRNEYFVKGGHLCGNL